MIDAQGDAPEISILLLGDSEVGKSTFLSRLSCGNNDLKSKDLPAPPRDLDQPFIYDIRLYNSSYRFEFSDTASPENYTLLRPALIILCYDVTSRRSLDNVKERWYREVHTHYLCDRELPVLLMGLKRDLRDENGVLPQEGYQVAQTMRCDRYIECSAVTGELVREAFEDIARTAALTTKDSGGLSAGGCVVS